MPPHPGRKIRLQRRPPQVFLLLKRRCPGKKVKNRKAGSASTNGGCLAVLRWQPLELQQPEAVAAEAVAVVKHRPEMIPAMLPLPGRISRDRKTYSAMFFAT